MGGAAAGMMGFKVRETIKASIQMTWYEQTATDVRRHHDQLSDNTGRQLSDEWYSPYLLRVDEAPEHLQVGATWTINYTKTKTTSSKPTETTNQIESWKVEAVDTVTAVPAGTFNALKVTRTDTADGSDQDAVVRARRRQGPRTHRRRPLRRADRLHHRPVASSDPLSLWERVGVRVRPGAVVERHDAHAGRQQLVVLEKRGRADETTAPRPRPCSCTPTGGWPGSPRRRRSCRRGRWWRPSPRAPRR